MALWDGEVPRAATGMMLPRCPFPGLLLLLLSARALAAPSVWPVPMHEEYARPQMVSATQSLQIATASNSKVVAAAVKRYSHILKGILPANTSTPETVRSGRDLLSNTTAAAATLLTANVVVDTDSDDLTAHTDVSYRLALDTKKDPQVVTLSAATPFGALHALETLVQLLDGSTPGTLQYGLITISDAPAIPYRGLVLDVAHRYVNEELLQGILDAMAAARLNVLEMQVVGNSEAVVMSDAYPGLSANSSGAYSPKLLSSVVDFAHNRGIRIVPRMDVPTTGAAFLPVLNQSDFCEPSHPTSLRNTNNTRTVLAKVISELAESFPAREMFAGISWPTRFSANCSATSQEQLASNITQFVHSNDKILGQYANNHSRPSANMTLFYS